MKINLHDVTFLIPVRIDSIIRLENLILVTEFLSDNFSTNVNVLEAAGYDNNLVKQLLPKDVKVNWVKDFDPIFHRTRYINELIHGCETDIVGIWDADVIIPKEQIVQSIELLRNRDAHFVHPYKDAFLDTSDIVRESFFKSRDVNALKFHSKKMKALYGPQPVGGAYFANRKAYFDAGLENEYFYGWGIEDGERINRWLILGYIHKRLEGNLFHLTHPRGSNSAFHSQRQILLKKNELNRIHSMSKKELQKEIQIWKTSKI